MMQKCMQGETGKFHWETEQSVTGGSMQEVTESTDSQWEGGERI